MDKAELLERKKNLEARGEKYLAGYVAAMVALGNDLLDDLGQLGEEVPADSRTLATYLRERARELMRDAEELRP